MKIAVRLMLGLAVLAAFGAHGSARTTLEKPDHDALAAERGGPFASPLVVADPDLIRRGTQIRMETRLNLPTFVWAGRAGRNPAAVSGLTGPLSAEGSAREHMLRYSSLYRLDPADVLAARLSGVHDTGRGAIIVSFDQTLDGIEVFRDEIKLTMDRSGNLVALSGYITRVERPPAKFILGPAEAIARAMEDLTGFGFTASDLRGSGDAGGYEVYRVSPAVEATAGVLAIDDPRVRRVWFRLTGGLEPAYALELNLGSMESKDSSMYSYAISAVDGRVLFRKNLVVADSFTYRVWADPAGDNVPLDGPQGPNGVDGTPHPTALPDGYQAPFDAPILLTLESGPISTGDPWLPNGATVTNGNNVDAYADISSPDGFTAGDMRADTTSTNTFDRVYDTGLDPDVSDNQRKAAVAQLFYMNNWLHDWYYDSGFDEVSGNAQTNNYGRGGVGGDSLRAEAQDFSGRNNATMATPSDGGRPRMHMFIFDGNGLNKVQVNSPGSIAGDYQVGTAVFGPQVFDVTGDVVYMNDATGVSPTDGCEEPWTTDVFGKIALIDRGNCDFTLKVQNALIGGASGAIIVNHSPGILNMGTQGPSPPLPSLLMDQADGQGIKDNLPGVNVRLFREAAADRDGTIDNQIVAHEWGHYISNRLVGNAAGLNTNMAGGLGEGWADFHALLMTVRPEDANHPANADYAGAYAMAGYVTSGGINNGYYFGIRRVPYSTDFSYNPLTFRHIANGQTIPATAPIAFGSDGSNNAEVHNTGEVWATMLWECYASMLRDTLGVSPRLTFDQAQQRMKDYLVAGYKMTPNSPTLLEARDAVLAAAAGNDILDYAGCFAGFAKRGAGVGAVAPDRFSATNIGVVESYLAGGDLLLVDATLSDDVATNCLPDGDLDTGETGTLSVTLLNTGSGSLTSTTGSVSTLNPGVSFPAGNALIFPTSAPLSTTVATIPVSYSGAVSIEEIVFDLAFDDPALAVAGPRMASVSLRGNADTTPAASAADDVEPETSAMTVASDGGLDTSLPWTRIEISGVDHRWLGPDTGAVSDHYLVTPPLQVASTGSFSFTFRHRHDFEATFDGGVIEITTNGGGTWTDIGASAVPTYNQAIVTGGDNPIEGRNAWSGLNAAHPALETVTVSLGTAYQGQTVQVRFRIGTDVFVDAPGWEIDDISFLNITNTPFPLLVQHDPTCDGDTDGFFDAQDCAPGDGNLWSAPSAVLDVTATGTGGGGIQFDWSAPGNPGGATAPTYDAIRVESGVAGTQICLETDDADLTMSDPAVPGDIYYYLIGARSACGRTIAPDSASQQRAVASCP